VYLGVYLIIIPVGFLTGWLIGVLYRPLPRSLLLLHHAVSSNATAHVVTTTTAKITITNLIVTAIPGLIAVTTLIMVFIGVLLLEASSSEVCRGQPKPQPHPPTTPTPFLNRWLFTGFHHLPPTVTPGHLTAAPPPPRAPCPTGLGNPGHG